MKEEEKVNITKKFKELMESLNELWTIVILAMTEEDEIPKGDFIFDIPIKEEMKNDNH